jgi:phage antirepressor YoqD-like protein
MSSREISELTGKRHDNVMRDIREMLIELHGEGGVLSFEDTHTNPQNGQDYVVFMLPKRETLILVSGYSVVMRAGIIDRWQHLEAQTQQPVAPTLPNLCDPATLRTMLLGYTEEVLALQAKVGQIEVEKAAIDAKLDVAAPKAKALDRMATGTDGSFCLTDAAKVLQSQPKRFIAKLQSLGWIHRRPMGSGWLAYQPRITQGVLEHKVTTGEKSDGHEWTSTQVRVTAKGMAKLAELFTTEESLS